MENDYELIKDKLIKAEDEEMISDFLKVMIANEDSWPDHFHKDADVFNKNPIEEFDPRDPIFMNVKPRTEACGKTDGCESGCWRIMCRDILIKSKEDGKILGFKKILKFCVKKKPREYKRSWVMEEYRLANKWNWKQDHVICKIRLLFEEEICYLLAKHFSYLRTSYPLPATHFLLDYGLTELPAHEVSLTHPQEEDEHYLQMIMDSVGTHWPSYVTNDVYRLDPLKLANPQDQRFIDFGIIIFANRTKTSDNTDGCDGGCWEITDGEMVIKSDNGDDLGFKRVLKFIEKKKRRHICEGEDVTATWTTEEYRLAQEVMQEKLLCVIKVKLSSIPLN